MINRQLQNFISLTIILACILFATAILYNVHATSREAKRFVEDFAGLTVNTTDFERVRAFATSYKDAANLEPRLVGTGSVDCHPEKCNFAFMFENGWLRRLRLAPPVWVRANVVVQNGLMTYKHVEIASGGGPAFFLASVSEGAEPVAENAKTLSMGFRRSGEYRWQVFVHLAPEAPSTERQMAYSLNMKCLSRLGGCNDAQELLPSVTWPPKQE